MFAHVISENIITVVVDGKTYIKSRDWPNFEGLKTAILNNDENAILDVIDLGSSVKKYSKNNFEIVGGYVYYKGEEIHNVVTERILACLKESDKYPVEGLINFLDNLLQNPSHRSVNELYTFLENEALPITSDGHFLAYKSVRDDYTDWHTGTVNNSIGEEPSMERNKVDDNYRNGCSYGYHVGSVAYALDFHSSKPRKLIMVKVNPKDVVSVPEHGNYQKLRTCSYLVIADYEGPLEKPMYQAKVNNISSPYIDFEDYNEKGLEEDDDFGLSDYENDNDEEFAEDSVDQEELSGPGRKWSPWEENYLREFKELNNSELAERLGRTSTAVRKKRARLLNS